MQAHPYKTALLASAASLLLSGSVDAQDRQAYFGETHVHTGWSFDAYIFGNTKTTPAGCDRKLETVPGTRLQM